MAHAYDRITIAQLEYYAYHGVLQEEQRIGQRYTVTVSLDTDVSQAGQTDDVAHTVDYRGVVDDVTRIMTGAPVQLIETLAARIAQALLTRDRVQTATVAVTKVQPPFATLCSGATVTIVRSRS
ncbi:MAG: dihydroneopterin aldolase [Paenibacillaceae bacterium]|nr:dihydroneopterin aldolase [Paenibacillaceae bacterium]